jgi:thiol-disulfide isomerase/thioredoxin
MKILERHNRPSFDGATSWLNSAPLSRSELTGRVVVVDFWTFTCINWLRQLPYVRAWSHAYKDHGLVVIGVHTPEFAFEHDLDRVQAAVAVRGIDYPVALDNDYRIWSALANRYWPALYFVDTDGIVRDFHYGEGRYEQSERVIQKLLGIDRAPAPVEAKGIEVPAAWSALRATETYLGYERGERFASPGAMSFDTPRTYRLPDRLRADHWALAGSWRVDYDKAVLEGDVGTISYRFHARDIHLVASTGSAAPVDFQVLLDGEAPGSSRGIDVDEHGRGVLDSGRLYSLIRQHEHVRTREVRVTFSAPGVEAYEFSFG